MLSVFLRKTSNLLSTGNAFCNFNALSALELAKICEPKRHRSAIVHLDQGQIYPRPLANQMAPLWYYFVILISGRPT